MTADKEILKLNNMRFKGGEASIMEVYQAEVLLQAAEAQAINLQQLIEQTENNISILLGQNPGPIVRGLGSDRTAAHAGDSRGIAVRFVGAASGCSRRGGKPGCSQCQCRRGQGKFLPAVFPHWIVRFTKHRALNVFAGPGNVLGSRTEELLSRFSKAEESRASTSWLGRSEMKLS